MRAWQYTTLVNGSLPQSLKLIQSAPLPTPKPNQHLVKINYVSLNPLDCKLAENPFMRRLLVPNPATPGIDFAGTIIQPATGSSLKPGDRVFGCGGPKPPGRCLAEYAVVGTEATIPVPRGLSLEHASAIGIAGFTAWQSIVPYNPKRVFLNGGSGGTGVFGIQIAKALGAEVVVSCSSRNVDLCKSLGADEVVDYTKGSVADALAKQPRKFDHVVDNVLADLDLFWKAHTYTEPKSKYVVVAASPSLKFIWQWAQMKWPTWLGGGHRQSRVLLAKADAAQLTQIADWLAEGKIRAVVDEKFSFENAPEAFEKLKTKRARGKIVVEVSPSSE